MKIIALLFLLLLDSCTGLPKKRTDRLSILQGVTNSKEVEFSIVSPKGKELMFELREETGEILQPEETKIISKDYSDYVIHKVLFVREAQKIYNLYVFEGGNLLDQRLVGRGQKETSRLRLAVVSCMNDFYPKQFGIWDTLSEYNPEYLILIGDNVYANHKSLTEKQDVTPEILWERYMDVRLSLPLYYQKKLIPTHALWDDNDYGMNDGDSSYKYKNESKEIFEAFWAQDIIEDDWVKGHGVGGLLTLGDFNLYFLDARMFRSPEKDGTQLGLDQTAWLYSKLREEETPSFIIEGDQFFGGYHAHDSFEGKHPSDFQNFVKELKQIKTPYVFLSGDRHMSEIMQFPRGLFGKPSFEITSSPMHGKVANIDATNPWRVVSTMGKTNFTIIDNLAKDNHWFMDVSNIDQEGAVNYRRELAVFIKDLQDNLKEVRKRRSGRRRYRRIRTKRRGRRRR